MKHLDYFSERPQGRVTVPRGIRLKSMKSRYACGLRVYLVDGCRIRNEIDVDFVFGGSGARYSYIPMQEIWIDNVLGKLDRDATIIHEVTERLRMIDDGMSYSDAHDCANVVERKFRARSVA